MLKKLIPLVVVGMALAGCGNNTNEALEDDRLTPEVKEDMTEESHPGIPGVGDLDENGNLGEMEMDGDGDINSKNSNNGNNNEENGTGNNEGITRDGETTLETPDMDGNMYESGLDDNS